MRSNEPHGVLIPGTISSEPPSRKVRLPVTVRLFQRPPMQKSEKIKQSPSQNSRFADSPRETAPAIPDSEELA